MSLLVFGQDTMVTAARFACPVCINHPGKRHAWDVVKCSTPGFEDRDSKRVHHERCRHHCEACRGSGLAASR
jgi:hypothetical protein